MVLTLRHRQGASKINAVNAINAAAPISLENFTMVDAGRLPDEDGAALAERLGYRQIGKELPDSVTLQEIIRTLPEEVFEINPVKAWSAVALTLASVSASIFFIAVDGAEHSHLAGRVGSESVLDTHLVNSNVVPQSVLATVALLEVSLDGLSLEVHLGGIHEGAGRNEHEQPVSILHDSATVVTDDTGVLVTEVVGSTSIVLVDGTSLDRKDRISVGLHLEVDTAGAPADAAGDEA